MMYRKKITVLLLTLALFIQPLTGTISRAAANDGISTLAENTSTISVALDIDTDGVTRCHGYVKGYPGTTKIAGTLKLMKGTTAVKSWTVSTASETLNVTKTCYVLTRGTYKLVLTVKVTRNGKTETISISKSQTY